MVFRPSTNWFEFSPVGALEKSIKNSKTLQIKSLQGFLLASNWQRYGKFRTLVFLACYVDPATMSLHHNIITYR